VGGEKLVEALAGCEPVEQYPDGNTSSLEHGSASVNIGIARIDDG
jgi:hypothetical protein